MTSRSYPSSFHNTTLMFSCPRINLLIQFKLNMNHVLYPDPEHLIDQMETFWCKSVHNQIKFPIIIDVFVKLTSVFELYIVVAMQSETCVPRTRNMCSDDEQIDFIVKMTCLLHHQTKSLILLIFCEVLLPSLHEVFVRRRRTYRS